MPLTASKRFMNWTNVGFTPTGGTLIPITGVTSVSFDSGGSIAKFSGDGDRYNSMMVNDFNEPTASVASADIAAVSNLGVGTTGIFTATHNDAKNGAATGGGGIVYTMLAVVGKNGFQGKHRTFGEAGITFDGASADGLTNPLSTMAA